MSGTACYQVQRVGFEVKARLIPVGLGGQNRRWGAGGPGRQVKSWGRTCLACIVMRLVLSGHCCGKQGDDSEI